MPGGGENLAEIPAKFKFAVRFRHARPRFPVPFCAGDVNESLARRIEAESLGYVVSKPFILHELAGAIRDRLSGPEQRPVLH